MSIRILQGDARDVLRSLPDASVHCAVTSPPYFGLRDYGVAGQTGLEPTPDEYVAQMVAVFREVRRVLRDDGTLWVNIGDSFAGGSSGDKNVGTVTQGAGYMQKAAKRAPVAGLKPKDLIGIPWMLAFALRADGWYLRSEIIWAKGSCMPESVRDRPTRSHEQIFLLSKSARYFYDAVAIEEDGEYAAGHSVKLGAKSRSRGHATGAGVTPSGNGNAGSVTLSGKRNKRSVWHINPKPFSAAGLDRYGDSPSTTDHFAVFPPELPETCIKAGTSERGCCPACGAAWVRVVEREVALVSGSGRAGRQPVGKNAGQPQTESGDYDVRMGPSVNVRTTGWEPTCTCPPADPIPCTVLDCFAGAGTTLMVADRLQRHAIGVELNPEYVAMIERRMRKDAGLFAEVAAE